MTLVLIGICFLLNLNISSFDGQKVCAGEEHSLSCMCSNTVSASTMFI
jgi:hypothetical protein